MSRQLIIAGSHRSGTSMVAHLLNHSGLFLGDDLLPANPSNPYGHFEDREVLNVHNGLLNDNGQTWEVTDRFLPVVSPQRWGELRSLIVKRLTSHDVWGFKDPRACLFLGLWKYLLPDAKVLIVYRHFSESALSLERRASINLFEGKGPLDRHREFWTVPDKAVRIWLAHNQAALAFARRHPKDVMVVSSDALWRGLPLPAMLEERWQLGLKAASIYDILDPGLRSQRRPRQPVADPSLPPRLQRTLAELQRLEQRSIGNLMGAKQEVALVG